MRMSFIRILLRLCIKHTERVKQSRLFPPLPPRQRYFNTARKLCWFPSTQSPISTAPRPGREGQGRECHGVCYQHRAPFPAKQSNIYSICTDRSPPMAVGWKENRRAAISGKRRMFQLRAEADALSSFLPVSCQLLTCFEHLETTDPVAIENKARLFY